MFDHINQFPDGLRQLLKKQVYYLLVCYYTVTARRAYWRWQNLKRELEGVRKVVKNKARLQDKITKARKYWLYLKLTGQDIQNARLNDFTNSSKKKSIQKSGMEAV